MGFYVYVLQSDVDSTYYKGFSVHPVQRTAQHNAGEMTYTSRKIPWQLVGIFSYGSKRDALIAEKKFKKMDHFRLQAKLKTADNILETYLRDIGL